MKIIEVKISDELARSLDMCTKYMGFTPEQIMTMATISYIRTLKKEIDFKNAQNANTAKGIKNSNDKH